MAGAQPALRRLIERIHDLAVVSVFPVLVVGLVCNQERDFPWLTIFGEIASLASIGLASALVLKPFADRRWAWVLVGLTLVTRASRLFLPDNTIVVIIYSVVVSILFAVAAAYLLAAYPRIVRRQLTTFLLLSFPLMFLQVLGVSPWLHVLRTDLHVAEDKSMTMVPVLFVPASAIIFTTLQGRPAGFLHANNLTTLLVIFSMALHLARPTRGALTVRDLGVIGVLILLMSKTAFLAFLFMLAALSLAGSGAHRRYVAKLIALVAVYLLIYWMLFPGLFYSNLSPDSAARNWNLRLADFLISSGNPALIDLAGRVVPGEAAEVSAGLPTQSAYAVLITGGITLLAGLVISALVYVRALRRLMIRFPEWSLSVLLSAVGLVVAPGMSSFLGSTVLGFFAGFGLLPLLLTGEPRVGEFMRASSLAGAWRLPRQF